MSRPKFRLVHRRNELTGAERFEIEVDMGEGWEAPAGRSLFGEPAEFDDVEEAKAQARRFLESWVWEDVAIIEEPFE